VGRKETLVVGRNRLSLHARRLSQSWLYRGVRYRLTRATLGLLGKEVIGKGFANSALTAEVLAYFADDRRSLYQLEQWLPVFEQLHQRHPVIILMRNVAAFNHVAGSTNLPVVVASGRPDVEDVFVGTDPKLCLYVNNASTNFQVLSWRRALHVHLNHGESDKISMASNQAKAYDAVFVAGEAAEARYLENLLNFDGANLVRVGRPQLDLDFPASLPRSSRSTVLYAPTWEGDTPAMNYTSLPAYGMQLVRQLVAAGDFRVVYKPHPRIVKGSRAMAALHKTIVSILEEANSGLPEDDRHVVELREPINSLFPSCDVAVCDVSSVALDWLYLRTEAPLWMCDTYAGPGTVFDASPLVRQTYVLDESAMQDLAPRIRDSIENDARRGEREQARRFYFGHLAPGQSTERFLEAIGDLAARRDALLAGKAEISQFEVASGVA
jgi:hypothetical protein